MHDKHQAQEPPKTKNKFSKPMQKTKIGETSKSEKKAKPVYSAPSEPMTSAVPCKLKEKTREPATWSTGGLPSNQWR